jgi:hypothetical protein
MTTPPETHASRILQRIRRCRETVAEMLDKSEGPGEKTGTEARSVGLHQSHPAQEKPGAGLPLSANVCPICKGKRGSWQHFTVDEAPDSWDHTDGESCECGPRFDACLGCHGEGVVSVLRNAALLARGDAPPTQSRRFA